jgi:hypothetical protein
VAPTSVPVGVDDQAALYRTVLTGKGVLIVIDNARDADQVRPLLPGSPGSLVLVTSRNQLCALAAEAARPLHVEPFARDEARQLLASRLGAGRVEREPEAADELSMLCARLPLALSVAAAHAVMRPGFPLAALSGDHDTHGLLPVVSASERRHGAGVQVARSSSRPRYLGSGGREPDRHAHREGL